VAGNRLGTFVEEVEKQPVVLREFLRSPLPAAAKGAIFVGAGDSFSAAMAGFYVSNGTCIAVDPYTLVGAPEIASGVDVFFISVSGRTASNLAAARKVRGLARRATAITSDEGSELAGLVDRVVRLPMEYVPRMPGLLSYSLSLLAVLRIAAGEEKCDFSGAYRTARRDEGKVAWGEVSTYFIGNSLAHAAAMYAAAKTYEFLGARAHPQLLEEFSHLELFSLGQSDVVNIYSAFDPFGASSRLSRALSRRGYKSNIVPKRGNSKIEELFHLVFVSQLSVLRRAGELRLSKPSFLAGDERLSVSDSMIY